MCLSERYDVILSRNRQTGTSVDAHWTGAGHVWRFRASKVGQEWNMWLGLGDSALLVHSAAWQGRGAKGLEVLSEHGQARASQH